MDCFAKGGAVPNLFTTVMAVLALGPGVSTLKVQIQYGSL